jgi:hypothetical protein
MRLWTVHPRYLDAKGLVAAWREALLAQKVLSGATRGYRHHPQLLRFQACDDPMAVIGVFLYGLSDEAQRRGYAFDVSRITRPRSRRRIRETRGQLAYEWLHLRRKLRTRAPTVAAAWRAVRQPDPHPLFILVAGTVRDWEKVAVRPSGRRRTAQPA